MQKIIALCFLTTTLAATSVHAQSIFIERGDPSTTSAMLGAGIVKNAWGASVIGSYSYRGVFDAGADFTRYAYTAGDNNNLAGYSLMPFVNWHAVRAEDSMPISISFVLGVQRIMYTGNAPAQTHPEGWGVLAGPSVYRRLEISEKFVLIPEVLLAYDLQYTRFYTTAGDQPSGRARLGSVGYGYGTQTSHGVRALFRPNMAFKGGDRSYTVMPYVGFQGAFAAGIDIGALF